MEKIVLFYDHKKKKKKKLLKKKKKIEEKIDKIIVNQCRMLLFSYFIS